MRPTRSKLPELYGEIIDGKWADEEKYMEVTSVPVDLCGPFNYRRIYCNKDMVLPLRKALIKITSRHLCGLIKSFDGCFNIRASRSDARQSVHSWGLAIDLNAATNQLGTDGDMSPAVVICFVEEGFIWGGDWNRKDPMHFQYVIED